MNGFPPSSAVLDAMHVSHFVIHFVIGLVLPDHWVLILTLDVLWEGLQAIIVQVPRLRTFTEQHWPIPIRYWNEGVPNKMIDLVCNVLGYAAGGAVHHRLVGRQSKRQHAFVPALND